MVLTRLLAEDTPLYELQEKLRQALEAPEKGRRGQRSSLRQNVQNRNTLFFVPPFVFSSKPTNLKRAGRAIKNKLPLLKT